MTPFAKAEDYERRYGSVDDTGRIEALLEDASVFIACQPGFSPGWRPCRKGTTT